MLLLQEKLANKQFLEEYGFADRLDGEDEESSDEDLSSSTSEDLEDAVWEYEDGHPKGLIVFKQSQSSERKSNDSNVFDQQFVQSFMQCILEIDLFKQKFQPGIINIDLHLKGSLTPAEEFANDKENWFLLKHIIDFFMDAFQQIDLKQSIHYDTKLLQHMFESYLKVGTAHEFMLSLL